MPRLPGPETVRYASSGGSPIATASAESFGAGVGRALQGTGNALDQAGQVVASINSSREQQEEHLATSQTEASLIEAQGKFSQDKDFKTVEKRASGEFESIVESAAKNLPQKRQDAFKSRFLPRVARATVEVQRRANQLDIEDQRATLNDTLATTQHIVDLAGASEQDRIEAVTRGREALAGAVTAGLLTQEKAKELNRDLSARVRFNTLSVEAESQPQQFLNNLADSVNRTQHGGKFSNVAIAVQSSLAETGTANLAAGSKQIANDTAGTKSYGFLGVNSGSGSAGQFAKENPTLGLTAKPGTAAFDRQWQEAVESSPQEIVDAQLAYHQKHIIKPAEGVLSKAGAAKFSKDQRVISFVSDGVVQYGPSIVQKHINAASGARSVEEFIAIAAQSQRDHIDRDFRTYLRDNPQNRDGLINRVDRRERDSLALAARITSTQLDGLTIKEERALRSTAERQIARVEQRIKREAAAQARADKQAFDSAHSDLRFRIHDGEASQSDIDEFREEFNPPFAKFDQLNKDFEEFREVQRIETALTSGGPSTIDPFDAGDRKAVNSFVDRQTRDLDLISGEGREIVGDVAERTGIVSPRFVNDVRQSIQSEEPEQTQAALQATQEIIAANPLARTSLSSSAGGKSVLTTIDAYNGFLERGLSEEAAVERVRALFDPNVVKDNKALLSSKETKDFLKDSVTVSKLSNIFDEGLFSRSPQVGATNLRQAAILDDYEEVLSDALVETGDQDAALAVAKERFGRLYGVSDLNLTGQNVLMRHPPEKTYPPIGGDHEYIRNQAVSALNDSGISLEDDSVFFLSDVQTDADISAGKLPRYQLYYSEKGSSVIQRYPQAFVADINEAANANTDNLRNEFDKHRDFETRRNRFLRGEAVSINGQLEGDSQ